ncbi:cadherin repeat domain-containing protein [Aurantiacibacter marinus]|uniref:Cadherin domain-containing protein n=1 Tax=Aurantiacibacter marinus TaxID=874156 RepID=A0A0H0XT14_9SPHN|nr:cadherin repeat domain-containing protein [Aurantiacibacter marinus]KLI63420.1 hypothetical protein AAV99_06430 [Aurantiacibacter marinus]
MTNAKFRAGVAGVCLVLAGCGGGSSGSGTRSNGGGGAANVAPSFTSPSTVSFIESQTFTDDRAVVQLSAADPDSGSLVFSFVAGKDAALFSFVNAPGRIAFNQAPSFETPRDANGDNVYEVDVSVSDGMATTRQSLRITLTNSTENLLFSEVATGLGANGRIAYLPDEDRILVVDEQGNMARVDARTGAITRAANRIAFGGGRIIDMAADQLSTNNEKFHVLASDGSHVRLLETRYDTGATTLIWEYRSPAPIEASIGLRGSQVLVALGDAGSAAAAQDPDDPRGNVILMAQGSTTANPGVIINIPVTVGWGLHDPIFPLAGNIGDWTIDRGERFNEISQGGFELSQSRANFEWPIRDGLTNVGFAGTVQGDRVAPRIVQEIGVGGAGRWLDAADSLQGDGWFGVWVIGDANGNIWTWDRNNSGPLELRNVDFEITNPAATRAFVSIDEGDFDVGTAIPIYMLRADGRLFKADLQR